MRARISSGVRGLASRSLKISTPSNPARPAAVSFSESRDPLSETVAMDVRTSILLSCRFTSRHGHESRRLGRAPQGARGCDICGSAAWTCPAPATRPGPPAPQGARNCATSPHHPGSRHTTRAARPKGALSHQHPHLAHPPAQKCPPASERHPVLPREQPKRVHRLEHGHAPAVQRRAPHPPGRAQQLGLQRPVHHLGDPQSGTAAARPERQPGMGRHPGGRRVHHPVGTSEQPLERVRRRGRRPPRAEVPVQPGGKIRRPVRHRVHDGDVPLRPASARRGYPPPPPRRAQLHDPLQRDIGQPAREGRREPGDVVAPDRTTALEDDGVDRAEGRRLGSELVEVVDDQLLAGVRDVQPVEAEVPRGPAPRSPTASGPTPSTSMSISRYR